MASYGKGNQTHETTVSLTAIRGSFTKCTSNPYRRLQQDKQRTQDKL